MNTGKEGQHKTILKKSRTSNSVNNMTTVLYVYVCSFACLGKKTGNKHTIILPEGSLCGKMMVFLLSFPNFSVFSNCSLLSMTDFFGKEKVFIYLFFGGTRV
jgi:hypothetical protein